MTYIYIYVIQFCSRLLSEIVIRSLCGLDSKISIPLFGIPKRAFLDIRFELRAPRFMQIYRERGMSRDDFTE